MPLKQLDHIQMVEDLNQLGCLLIDSHPDPYARLSSPIAFHRLVAELRQALPEKASTRQFLRLLRPLVAAVGDGHTSLSLPRPSTDQWSSRRVWLDWAVVGGCLYLSRVYRAEDAHLIGSRLERVGGVSFSELRRRLGRMVGYDNRVDLLRRLGRALADPEMSLELLQVDQPPSATEVRLRMPDGRRHTLHLDWTEEAPGSAIEPDSLLNPPALGPSGLGWGFLDEAKKVACLRVGELMSYREAFEVWRRGGFLAPLIERLGPEEVTHAPTDAELDRLLAATPSASEMLRELFAAVAENKTPWLMVDLSQAPGGNSAFAGILGYCLYGPEAMLRLEQGYQIPRYSQLYAENYGSLPKTGDWTSGGYDFTAEQTWSRLRKTGWSAEEESLARVQWEAFVSAMPSFAKLAGEGWRPTSPQLGVVVATSANTYSAGFDVAAMLVSGGALHVGVAPAQSGNCFIDILRFRLQHSGLIGTISFKQSLMKPDQPNSPALLQPEPERTLDYQRLAAWGFDPHAGLRLALEAIGLPVPG